MGSNNGRNRPTTVEEALERYWQGGGGNPSDNIPDYSGFTKWFIDATEAIKASATVRTYRGSQQVRALLALNRQLVEALAKEGVNVTTKVALPDAARFGKSRRRKVTLKSQNRGKLLLSLLNSAMDDRARGLLLTLTNPNSLAADASSIKPAASQAEHRAALFSALSSGDDHNAFKMLGRLREEAHDPGEIDYLEGLACFKANRFEDAIRCLHGVGEDTADGPAAFALHLECTAFLGNMDQLQREIQSKPELVFPKWLVPYLCQVAVKNSSEPEAALQVAVSILSTVKFSLEEDPDSFRDFNRYSCQVAVQYLEQLQNVEMRDLARGDDAGGNEVQPSLGARQVACAFVVDVPMFEAMRAEDGEPAHIKVVKRLLNHGTPSKEEYLLAFSCQWRLGDREQFLANVKGSLDVLAAVDDPGAWQLIMWAYQQALVLGMADDARLLEQRLRDSPLTAAQVQQASESAVENRLEMQLSAMGRFAFRWANWDLRNSSTEECSWRDAGMISLGFFRILELEFNERIVFPTVAKLDFEALEAAVSSIPDSSAGKKASESWARLSRALGQAKSTRKGLELGTLEMLLRKVKDCVGVDGGPKAFVRAAIETCLTSHGAEALGSGELADLVSEGPRERFRNTPAHARFVDIATARQSRAYLEESLEKLFRYTRAYAAGRTLH